MDHHWALHTYTGHFPVFGRPITAIAWSRTQSCSPVAYVLCCCWTSRNPGQVQKKAGQLMRHKSIRVGGFICVVWLSVSSKSQWEISLRSRKEQYHKHQMIYGNWKTIKQSGLRYLNVKIVYKCREKDSSILLTVTKAKVRSTLLLSKTPQENYSAQTHICVILDV